MKEADPKLSSNEIAEKVRKEVVPALKVQVHKVRKLKRRAAINRTPSALEAFKVVASKKLVEVMEDGAEPGRQAPPDGRCGHGAHTGRLTSIS